MLNDMNFYWVSPILFEINKGAGPYGSYGY